MKKEDLIYFYFQESISCLNAVEKLFYDFDISKSISAFLMHLSIELFLKGWLTDLDIEFKKNHDLEKLVKKIDPIIFDMNTEIQLKKINTYFLHRYNMDEENLEKISDKLEELGDHFSKTPLSLNYFDLQNFINLSTELKNNLPANLREVYTNAENYLKQFNNINS